MDEPALGTIGVVKTKGFYGDVIRWATESPASHAVIYVGDGQIVEGEPEGARFAPADEYGDDLVWLTDLRRTTIDGVRGPLLEPTDSQRAKIVELAKVCAVSKVAYSWLDIAVLALASPRLSRIDVRNPPWWARRMAANDRLVCSQLVDLCWRRAGVHIFVDRIPGLVSPGDLHRAGGSPPLP